MTDPGSFADHAPDLALGAAEPAYWAVVDEARERRWANRLFDRDVSLWTSDEAVAVAISDRLGWLDAPEHFTQRIPGLEGFGDGIVEAGFTTVVVAGMGGSSLAPDVLHRTFGSQDGYLDLRLLDSTDPEAVTAALDDLDPLTTLVIIASKSGHDDRAERLPRRRPGSAPMRRSTLATTRSSRRPARSSPPSPTRARACEAIKHHDDFREVFLNPPDIGGRYSALTYVGLVPASLIGLDLDALLASALVMLGACREPEPSSNPGISLGIAMGALAKAGRDKLTFLPDDEIASFGAWAEQLIAESTGKHGVGIVPVDARAPRRGRGVRRRPGLRADGARGRHGRWSGRPGRRARMPPVTRSSGST